MSKNRSTLIHDINSNINSLLQVCSIIDKGNKDVNFEKVVKLVPEKVTELYENWSELQSLADDID